jgi:hypothetical protein
MLLYSEIGSLLEKDGLERRLAVRTPTPEEEAVVTR